MSDLIDRQAAMKIRFSSGFDHDGILFIPYRDVEEHLKKLPSVQPEIIRCKYCKHWNNIPTSDGYNSCEKDALIRHESFFCANGKMRGGLDDR